ncbi:MAG: mechanosensitive ion channel [Bacteroidales bacterium]|nr:mechanosensitive ion channel [Bacteroidales bacterium]
MKMFNFLQVQVAEIQEVVDAKSAELASDSIPVVSDIASTVLELKDKPVSEVFQFMWGKLLDFGLKVIAALAIYIIGAFLIKWLVRLMKKIFEKRKTDLSLAGFLISLTKVVMIILLVVIIIGVLGVNTTSFAALLASGGLAIGMALSGALQNFAGGVMILAFKPFKVGDFIDAMGFSGTVKKIAITTTRIHTVDNKEIIIPNGTLSNSSINNFSSTGNRRVDWTLSLTYGDSFEDAKKAILEILKDEKRMLKDTEPQVILFQLSESAIQVSVRLWVKLKDYWDVYFEYNEKFYEQLPKAGLHFAYPHLSVDLKTKA